MKKHLLVIILFILSIFSMPPTMEAQTRITATITLNTSPYPTNGDTVTVNGSVRTWVNATPTVTQILEDPTIGGCATNMFDAFSANGFTGPLYLAQPSSNVITLQGQIGQALTVTLSPSGIGSVTYYSQTVVSGVPVVVPITSEIQSTTAVMIASELVTNINTLSTNPFTANLLPTNNFLPATNANGGTISNLQATNLMGVVPLTNLPAAVTNASQYIAATNGNAATLTNLQAGNLVGTVPLTNLPTAVTNTSQYVAATNGTAINPTLSGGQSLSHTNQSSIFSGTNNWVGDIAYPGVALGTLATGENADLVTSTNIYIRVSGPTGAFSIDGMAGGREGRQLLIENDTGYTLTVRNNSGLESTPGNRIYTGPSAADQVFIGSPSIIAFIYNGTSARWVLDAANTSSGGTVQSIDGLLSQPTNLVSVTYTNSPWTRVETNWGWVDYSNGVVMDYGSNGIFSNAGPVYLGGRLYGPPNVDFPLPNAYSFLDLFLNGTPQVLLSNVNYRQGILMDGNGAIDFWGPVAAPDGRPSFIFYGGPMFQGGTFTWNQVSSLSSTPPTFQIWANADGSTVDNGPFTIGIKNYPDWNDLTSVLGGGGGSSGGPSNYFGIDAQCGVSASVIWDSFTNVSGQSSYIASFTDRRVLCNPSSASCQITLPALGVPFGGGYAPSTPSPWSHTMYIYEGITGSSSGTASYVVENLGSNTANSLSVCVAGHPWFTNMGTTNLVIPNQTSVRLTTDGANIVAEFASMTLTPQIDVFRHTSSYTLVNATVQSNAVAHNLGAIPSVVRLVIACVASDAASGFQAGQEMNSDDFIDTSGNSIPACTAWADATNVYLYFDGCVQSSINLKGNGGISSMTNFAMKAYFAP